MLPGCGSAFEFISVCNAERTQRSKMLRLQKDATDLAAALPADDKILQTFLHSNENSNRSSFSANYNPIMNGHAISMTPKAKSSADHIRDSLTEWQRATDAMTEIFPKRASRGERMTGFRLRFAREAILSGADPTFHALAPYPAMPLIPNPLTVVELIFMGSLPMWVDLFPFVDEDETP